MKNILKILLLVIVLSTLIGCETMDTDSVKAEPNEKITESREKTTKNKVKSTPSVDASNNEVKTLNEEDVIGNYWLNSLNDLDNNVLMTKKDFCNVLMFQCDPNFALLEDGTATHLVSFACSYGKWQIKGNKIEIITDHGSIDTYIYDNGYLYRKVKMEDYISHLDSNPFDTDINEMYEYYEKGPLQDYNYIDENNY